MINVITKYYTSFCCLIFRWPQANLARQDLRYFDSLGQGWFGWIVRGRYRRSPELEYSKDQSVIVCMLKEEANVEEKRHFLDETQFSAHYSFLPEENHGVDIVKNEGLKNVVKLIGICLEKPPFLAIYEECQQGDLKSFLLNRKGISKSIDQQNYEIKKIILCLF